MKKIWRTIYELFHAIGIHFLFPKTYRRLNDRFERLINKDEFDQLYPQGYAVQGLRGYRGFSGFTGTVAEPPQPKRHGMFFELGRKLDLHSKSGWECHVVTMTTSSIENISFPAVRGYTGCTFQTDVWMPQMDGRHR